MKIVRVLFVTLGSILFFKTHAADGMKPGLWEHNFTMKSQSGKIEKAIAEMRKQMTAMPAEQRKVVAEMMAKQGLGFDLGKATSLKVCISKEQAEKMEFPNGQNDKCKNEITKRTSTKIEMKFKCEGDPKSDGTAVFTLKSPVAYIGKAVINLTTQGKYDRMNVDSEGKWLSADCGNVKSIPTKNNMTTAS